MSTRDLPITKQKYLPFLPLLLVWHYCLLRCYDSSILTIMFISFVV
jgi:hypothetical protein